MLKKVLLLVLGFGLITGGIAGIATSLVSERNRAAVRELEAVQERTRAAIQEEQRKLDEKRKEIERMAAEVEAEKQCLQVERRLADGVNRGGEADSKDTERPIAGTQSAPPGKNGEGSVSKRKEQPAPPVGVGEPKRRVERKAVPRRSVAAKSPKAGQENSETRWISRKASLEAARLFEPVEYYNRYSRHLVLAEPFGPVDGSMRVRVRIWKEDRLVKDTWLHVPLGHMHHLQTPWL